MELKQLADEAARDLLEQRTTITRGKSKEMPRNLTVDVKGDDDEDDPALWAFEETDDFEG